MEPNLKPLSLPSEDLPRLWFQNHTASWRHSNSNPRVSPHDSNSFHPAADQRWIPQITKVVKRLYPPTRPGLCNDPTTHQIIRDNNAIASIPTTKIQPRRLWRSVDSSQLVEICIYPYPLHRLYYVQIRPFSKEKEIASLILRTHITPHW